MTKGRCITIVLIVIWYIVFPFLLIDTGSSDIFTLDCKSCSFTPWWMDLWEDVWV